MNYRSLHFVGIGGIGMSGLAQLARAAGLEVSGSDRGADRPENQRIFRAFAAQGIRVFPQDGSFADQIAPDALVYSSAIESDNPDFARLPALPRLHRAEALQLAIQRAGVTPAIAVSGSCGKTSVTSYLAEALYRLGADPMALNGGLINAFQSDTYAGNFRAGRDALVFEADESDKSLLAYHPDYALVLNIGTDHYDKAELARVFAEFVRHAQRGAVMAEEVEAALHDALPAGLPVRIFRSAEVTGYEITGGTAYAEFFGRYRVRLPQPGFHTALNLLAAGTMLELLGYPWERIAPALGELHGVWRRFDPAGRMRGTQARVFDDYAHNPEKICCVIRAAQELAGADGRVVTLFQPHGYGPLGFMQDELYRQLHETLRAGDAFWLLEPFYAGGSSSFSPKASEVVTDWTRRGGLPGLRHPADRMAAERELRDGMDLNADDIVLVLGARDNSLSDWAKSLTEI